MYLRLGGMHVLMNFVGHIGFLRIDSDISIVLLEVFGGVKNQTEWTFRADGNVSGCGKFGHG